ncbi:MAG: hypothetical protein GTO41_21810 [Burkholderiales bacterium]|nr:hypothetical protein [Burkholderiales bacterium]
MIRRLFLIALMVLVAGCTTGLGSINGSGNVTGTQRAPTDPAQVKVFLEAPPSYEVIGFVEARVTGGRTTQESQNYALAELKKQAAAIGANAIVLRAAGTEITPYGTFKPDGGGTFQPYEKRQNILSAIAIYVGS